MKKNNLKKNTIFLAIGTFLNKGLLFVMIPLFSRWLSTEDYGRFDLFTTYVTLMIPIITLACSEAVFRYGIEKETVEEKSEYISNGLALIVFNTGIMAIVLFFIYFWTGGELIIPFFLMAFGEILNNYLRGYMRAIRKLNIYSFCSAFSTLCIAVYTTIFVLGFNLGLRGMILGYAFGYLTGDLAIVIVTDYRKYINRSLISFHSIKELVSYSYALIPNNISWWIINVSDRSIIKIFLGATANGIYAVSSKIPNFASALFGVFSISWQETATDTVTLQDRNEYYNKILNQMCGFLIPLCGGIICCNFILFGFVFDNRYSTGALYAPILVTSVIFSSLSQYFGGIQISLKRPKANGITTVIGAAVNLFVHFSMVGFIGLYAAAVSTLISNIVITVVRVHLLRNDITFKIQKRIWLYVFIYLYFITLSYLNLTFGLRIFNLLLSGFVFLTINKNLLFKYLHH